MSESPYNNRAEERAAKLAKAKELLNVGVRALQTSDDRKELLERVARNARSRFRISRYSFMNQMLVWTQSPRPPRRRATGNGRRPGVRFAQGREGDADRSGSPGAARRSG